MRRWNNNNNENAQSNLETGRVAARGGRPMHVWPPPRVVVLSSTVFAAWRQCARPYKHDSLYPPHPSHHGFERSMM